MKKTLINLIAVLFLTSMFFACGNNSGNENNDATESDTSAVDATAENNTDSGTEETVKEKPENKIAFDKFEDYAEIKTKKDLIAQFGKENLKDGSKFYAEGEMEKYTTTLTNPENKYEITYVWKDSGDSTEWIEADYTLFNKDYNIKGNQKIKTRNGLYLGMSLKELRDWNGADFKFYGFGWDYAGMIISGLKKSPIEISLSMAGDFDVFDFATGDVELSADNPKLKDAGIYVSSFSMYVK